jgi:hypothetical protein
MLGDQPPHRHFGGAVGDGDRRQVGLVVDREGLAKMGPDRLSRRIGEEGREGEVLVGYDRIPPDDVAYFRLLR